MYKVQRNYQQNTLDKLPIGVGIQIYLMKNKLKCYKQDKRHPLRLLPPPIIQKEINMWPMKCSL